MDDVTILIVNWNTRDRLRRCLGALAALPDRVPRDVMVVDNGSTDGSAEMVAAEHPSVRLIRNARNEGFARAVNRGIGESVSPFILLLNSDAELRGGALDVLVDTLRATPEAAAAGAQLYKPDGRRQHAFDVFPSLLTEVVNKGLLRRLRPDRFPSRLQPREDAFEVDSLIGACMLLRREAVDSVGLLDERFFVFYEETDWCLRARRDGWRIVLVPRAGAEHAQGETKAHHPGRARVEYWRSKYAYFDKHRGRGVRRVLQALSCFRLTVQALLQGVACAATLGLSPSLRRKLAADAWLWAWHVAGTPAGFGFSPSEPVPGYVRTREPDGDTWMPADKALATRGTPLYRLRTFLDTDASRRVKEGRTKIHYRVTLAEEGRHREWIVKVYKPGGMADRMKAACRGTRAMRELTRMVTAARRGVPVPLPTLVSEWKDGRSALTFEPLDGWGLLDVWLRSADGPPAFGRVRHETMRRLGLFARQVYDAGVDQDDFNPTNLFVRFEPGTGVRFLLVDFERVRIVPSVSLARRLRTLAKMGRVRAWASRADRVRFLRAMLPARTTRDALRSFLRDLGMEWARVQERDRSRR